MVAWLNRVVYQLPRNGTLFHAVDPTSSTNLVSGTAFTPTTGSLLVAVVEGAVTSSTPSGWTLPSGGSAVNNTGLYVWRKTAAAGANNFSTTHNVSNYPIAVAIYEFPGGSTFVGSVANASISFSAANPNLTGLTGTNLVMAAKAVDISSGGSHTNAAWTGTGTPVEDFDLSTPYSGTDGYALSVAYVENFAGSSWQPTGTFSTTTGVTTAEALTFAINVASGATNYNGSSSLTGNGAIAASGALVFSHSASLAGTGAITAAGSVGKVAGSTLAGSGTIGNGAVWGGIAHVKDLTPTNTKSNGTNNLSVSIPAGGIAAGNTIVIGVVSNNSASGSPSVSSIDVPVGETAKWKPLGAPSSPTGTALAGVRTSMWAIQTTMAWPGSTDYPITLSGSVSAKAVIGREYSGVSDIRRGSSTTASSTTGALSGTHASGNIQAGDVVLAVAGFESATAGSDDTDTTSGTWSASSLSATSGSGDDTNVAVMMQHKFVTSNAAQSFDTTGASTDATAIIATLIPAPQVAALYGTGTILASGSLAGAPSADAALAGTGAISAGGLVGTVADATLAGTGTATAAGVVGVLSGATVAGSGTISTAGSVGVSRGSSLSGTATISAAGSVGTSGVSALGGTGTISAGGVVSKTAGASIAGVGAITSTGTSGGIVASVQGAGVITSTGFVGTSKGSALAGTAAAFATGSVGKSSGAGVPGSGITTTAGSVGVSRSAGVAGTATIVAGGVLGFTSGASLTGVGTIATLTGQLPLAGSADLVATGVVSAVGLMTPFGGWPVAHGRTLTMSIITRTLEVASPSRKLDITTPTRTLNWNPS